MSHWIRALILTLVSTPAVAQREEFTLRVEVPVVAVDVSVFDRAGRPVEGLGSDQFQIFEDGVLQEVRYFGSSVEPYHVYLLFDASGSTRHQWDFMNQAVRSFLRTLQPEDRVALGWFDSRLRQIAGWQDAGSAMESAIALPDEVLSSGGTTEFYDGLEDVIENGFAEIPDRRAVVVLTDGRDTSLYRELVQRNRLPEMRDDPAFRDLYETAAARGIPVYIVAINTDRNLETNMDGADEYKNLRIIFRNYRTPRDYLEQVRRRMEAIAEVSGGSILFPNGIEEVNVLFEQIARTLGQAYSLGYTPPPADGDALRHIRVQLQDASLQVRQSRTSYRSR